MIEISCSHPSEKLEIDPYVTVDPSGYVRHKRVRITCQVCGESCDFSALNALLEAHAAGATWVA